MSNTPNPPHPQDPVRPPRQLRPFRQIHINVPPETFERIQYMASRQTRNVSNYLVWLHEEHVKRESSRVSWVEGK